MNVHPMTTVLMLERSLTRARVEGILRWAVLVCCALGRPALGQDRPVHWLNAGVMPPGAIGSQRLQRGGPLLGYFQPVRIRAPQGARIALAAEGSFTDSPPGDALVGMQVGPVYRLKVTDIPSNPGLEVFPTIELVDRLYPPPNQRLRFPIPIELTQAELELAARGSFVTRVIYVESPDTALPIAQPASGEQAWIEAPPGADPLVTADERGRPVAILRIGSRVPSASAQATACTAPPEFVLFDAENACPMPEAPVGKAEEVYTGSERPLNLSAEPQAEMSPAIEQSPVEVMPKQQSASSALETPPTEESTPRVKRSASRMREAAKSSLRFPDEITR